MDAVSRGGNRQELHERLRVHSQAAASHVKAEGGSNDLIERLLNDEAFHLRRGDLESILRPEQFTGRSEEQVTEFLREVIRPMLAAHRDVLGENQELFV
jgi:adenylosuccinate lyase